MHGGHERLLPRQNCGARLDSRFLRVPDQNAFNVGNQISFADFH